MGLVPSAGWLDRLRALDLARRFDPARFWRSIAPAGHRPTAAEVLRLVQVAVLGAFGAALAAEIAAVSATATASVPLTETATATMSVPVAAAQAASALAILAPSADAFHPFLPVLLGLLLTPLAVAAIGFSVGLAYSRPGGTLSWFALLLVAIYGAVPIYVAMLCVVLPFGIAVVAAGVLLSGVAWTTGYRHVLGVPAGAGAQCFGLAVLAALAILPMFGALLATLA